MQTSIQGSASVNQNVKQDSLGANGAAAEGGPSPRDITWGETGFPFKENTCRVAPGAEWINNPVTYGLICGDLREEQNGGLPAVTLDDVSISFRRRVGGKLPVERLPDVARLIRWAKACFALYGHNLGDLEAIPGQGLHGFEKTLGFYSEGDRLFTFAWGGAGQKGAVWFRIHGKGCGRLLPKAFERLYALALKHGGKLTRCDPAVDFFKGEKTVDECRKAWLEDHSAFVCRQGGRRPGSKVNGPWDDPHDMSGRSFYVGSRSSGKMLRCYEKGRQLGRNGSNWVRFEVEFKADKRELPLDMLLPQNWLKYWAGAYPYLERMSGGVEGIQIASRSRSAIESAVILVERTFQTIAHQYGSALHLLSAAFGRETVLDKISRPGRWKRFNKLAGSTAHEELSKAWIRDKNSKRHKDAERPRQGECRAAAASVSELLDGLRNLLLVSEMKGGVAS